MLSAKQKEKLVNGIGTAVIAWEFVHHNIPSVIESAVDEAVAACHRAVHREVKAFFSGHKHSIDIKWLNTEQILELTEKISKAITEKTGIKNNLFTEGFTDRLNNTVRNLSQCLECDEKIRRETIRLQSLLEYAGPRLCEAALDCITPMLLSVVLNQKKTAGRLFSYIFNDGLPSNEPSVNRETLSEALRDEIIRLCCAQITTTLYDYLDELMEEYQSIVSEAA
ncbi:MAG: hypothetical protein VR68_00565 [Peptococcaceae bacterium BRH_c4a]|nr:MAG: hypothetical protein VR68_00565 [Peptococcaceae bacterium BRH_c4a]